ncbi:MAG: hypothetical protein AMXMBFR33_68140 [Candidatus Xenobia bacterium]
MSQAVVQAVLKLLDRVEAIEAIREVADVDEDRTRPARQASVAPGSYIGC